MVPWIYKLMDGDSWGSVEMKLKPGESPPERINVKTKGYLLKEIGIEKNVGIAVYRKIMEVI